MYCRGCRCPFGRSTNTDTYCPGLISGRSPPSAGSMIREMTSWVSSIRPHHPIRAQRPGRVDTGLLIEAGLFGDELGGEQPVHLVPGVGDLRGDRVAEDLTDRGEQVMADDGVLLRADSQRDVFVGNAFQDMVEGRRGGSINCTA